MTALHDPRHASRGRTERARVERTRATRERTMSVLGSLMSKILGNSARDEAAKENAAMASRAAAPAAPAPSTGASASASTAPTPPVVDVELVLETKAAGAGQKLDWRHSIVDLMKLVGIDSSLANRRALAQELGYTGDTNDTATMNIWLHKQVLRKLSENGGRVPADLMS
jgi:hypothetical protein